MSATSANAEARDEGLDNRKLEAYGDSGSSVMDALKQIFSLAGPAKQELKNVSRQLAEDKAQLAERSKLPGTVQLVQLGLKKALGEAKFEVDKLNKQDQTYSHSLSNIQIKLQEDLQTIETDVGKLVEHVKESKVAYQDLIKRQEDEIASLKRFESNQHNNDVKALQKKLMEKDKELAQLSRMRETKEAALQKELSETKTRLSKLMGDRLSDKNPDIADLSDKNRPTKIAERFNELYDNQWTDAFEKAEKMFPNKPEQKRIQLLIQLLMDVNTFCKRKFERHDTDLTNALKRIQSQNIGPYEEIIHQAKVHWRISAEDCVESLLQEYLTPDDLKGGLVQRLASDAKDFTKECVAVCWLMVHQDPPVTFHLNVVKGEKFNSSLYKAYTKSGPEVDYVVWPALLLHEGGAVLGKGVVQCRDATGKPANTDGELHIIHKPKIENEPDEPSSDNTAHNKQSVKGSEGKGSVPSQSVREPYTVASMKVINDLSRSLKPSGTTQEGHFENLLKELGVDSSGSSSTQGEPYGATPTNDKSHVASETQGFSSSYQNTSDRQLSNQSCNMTTVCNQAAGTSYLANQNYQQHVYSDPEYQSPKQKNPTTANHAHYQQPNTRVSSQNQKHYEFDPLYSANVSNSQNFGVPFSPSSTQQQATPNNNCSSWNPSTNQQQVHSQYPQPVNGGIQQPAMVQAKSRPLEQYPQTLVPNDWEMRIYYYYLQYHHNNIETARYYTDWYAGKGVFDKCDNYIRWLQSFRGN